MWALYIYIYLYCHTMCFDNNSAKIHPVSLPLKFGSSFYFNDPLSLIASAMYKLIWNYQLQSVLPPRMYTEKKTDSTPEVINYPQLI